MNFNELKKVENHTFYIDVAFNKANKKAELARETKKRNENRLERSRRIELQKIDVIRGVLGDKLLFIVKNFPSFDDLSLFYQELIKEEIGLKELKKSLAALIWARNKIDEFHRKYAYKIKRSTEFTIVNAHRREYYGRIASVMKQVKKELEFLEKARKTMRGFPGLKTKLYTVAIAGFPNVGKSTVLTKLTSSDPEINSYPFTTKGIMVGFMEGKDKIQLLDTPGTLDRQDKMNIIETRAWLAMRYLANTIVYVFDLTEIYPIKKQEQLLENIKKLDKEMIIFISKKDLLKEEDIKNFKKTHPKLIDNTEELKQKIIFYSQQPE